MSITDRLNQALKPHGFSAKRLPNDEPEFMDDCVEIMDRDGQITAIDVQIYSNGSGAGYGVNRMESDGVATLYSGKSAVDATSAVLKALGLS